MNAIYIAKGDVRLGPFEMEKVRQMLAAGEVSLEDLAWADGRPDWEPLRILLDPGLQPPPLPPQAQAGRRSAWTESGPRGVGGWLVFFCVGLTILSPLLTLGQVAGTLTESMEEAFQRYPTLRTAVLWENGCALAIMIYGIVVGALIWSGHRKGRTYARQYLMISLVAVIAVEVIALMLMGDLPDAMTNEAQRSVGVQIFRRGVYFTIWWFYFKKSERVRNTYGEETAEGEEGAER